jgi:hypothetical protein
MARSGWARSLTGAGVLTLLGATGALAQVCPLPAFTVGAPVGTDMYGPGIASAGGLVYVAGGYSFSTGGVVNQFKSYNPATNTWATLANLPTAVSMGSLAYDAVGGRLFLFGGTNVTVGPFNISQVYNIATNTWSAGPNLPDFRAFMSSGTIGNFIYLVGGYSTGNVSPAFNTNWQFNPVTGTFTTKAVLPALLGGAGSAVSGGRLYVIGGRTDANIVVQTNYEYDPVADTWATKAPLPGATGNVPGATALSGTAACTGDIIVTGGGNPFGPSEATFPDPSRSIEATAATNLYDVATNTWSAGPTMGTPRSFTTAAQAADNLIVVGGYTGATTTAAVDRIAGPPLPVNLSGFTVE